MQSSRASETGQRDGLDSAEPAEQQDGERVADAAQRDLEAAQRELEADLARMEDRYKRALADLDNYRKRTAREAEQRALENQERLLRDWLEVIDSLERAVLMQPEDPVVEGLRAVLDQMEGVLARQGVARIGAQGETFDPERHEAVDVRSTNAVPDRTVLEVARSGFTLGDRVLRPAQVVVSRAPGDG